MARYDGVARRRMEAVSHRGDEEAARAPRGMETDEDEDACSRVKKGGTDGTKLRSDGREDLDQKPNT